MIEYKYGFSRNVNIKAILCAGVWTIEEKISDMSINRDVHKQVGQKELGHIC